MTDMALEQGYLSQKPSPGSSRTGALEAIASPLFLSLRDELGDPEHTESRTCYEPRPRSPSIKMPATKKGKDPATVITDNGMRDLVATVAKAQRGSKCATQTKTQLVHGFRNLMSWGDGLLQPS